MKRTGYHENNRLLTRIISHVRTLAKGVALFLQQKTERLTLHAKRKGLILFCSLGIGCSVSVIYYSFGNVQSSLLVNPIRLPVSIVKPFHFSDIKDSSITTDQYKRIRLFEEYLTKEKSSASGKAFYDSLLKARPQLPDSLRAIDSIFLSQ